MVISEERKIVCHASGDRCHGCTHYSGTSDTCEHAPQEADMLPAETVAWAFIDCHQAPIHLHSALADLVRRSRNDVLAIRADEATKP